MAYGKSSVTEISLVSNPDHLVRLRRIIGCLADCAGMDSREVHDAKLAITEACANAIHHGAPNPSVDKLTVRISSTRGMVVTEVSDGSGFDSSQLDLKTMPDATSFGIPVMKALTDEVELVQNGKGMTVRFVKRAKRHLRRRWISTRR